MSAARPLLLAAAAALLAGPAAADYKDTYKKAMEAVDRGNWAEVERLMRQAAAEQPKEGEKIKLYGMRFADYLPQYYLGLALFHGGNCEGALQAWQASESQGAVQKTGAQRTLAKNKAECQTRVARARPSATPAGPDPAAVARAMREADEAMVRAEQQATAATALQSDPALAGAWAGDAALGGAQREAASVLDAARGRLATARGKSDLAGLQQAQAELARAAQMFEGVAREAEARREAARRAAADRPSAAPSAAGPTAAAGPPAELLAAARAYFGGDYQQAVAVLSRVTAAPGRGGAQSMLLRAASRHALYLLSNRREEGLRRDAESDVRACRRLDPGFAPDARFFSPRFAEFFRAVR